MKYQVTNNCWNFLEQLASLAHSVQQEPHVQLIASSSAIWARSLHLCFPLPYSLLFSFFFISLTNFPAIICLCFILSNGQLQDQIWSALVSLCVGSIVFIRLLLCSYSLCTISVVSLSWKCWAWIELKLEVSSNKASGRKVGNVPCHGGKGWAFLHLS